MLPNYIEYRDRAIFAAATCVQWQASDATDDGNGYPISEEGDEYTDRVAEVIRESVTDFISENFSTLVEAGVTPEMAGHDLVLTANGHGAGFWDRGLGEPGDVLTEASRGYSVDAEFALDPDTDEVAFLCVENTVITGDTE